MKLMAVTMLGVGYALGTKAGPGTLRADLQAGA